MANHKLEKLVCSSEDLHRLIPNLVNKHGQKGAAEQLGVTQGTISQWLKNNGYTLKTEWVKEGAQAEPVAN